MLLIGNILVTLVCNSSSDHDGWLPPFRESFDSAQLPHRLQGLSWEMLLQTSATIWSFFMLPMSATALTALVAHTEHGPRAWDTLRAASATLAFVCGQGCRGAGAGVGNECAVGRDDFRGALRRGSPISSANKLAVDGHRSSISLAELPRYRRPHHPDATLRLLEAAAFLTVGKTRLRTLAERAMPGIDRALDGNPSEQCPCHRQSHQDSPVSHLNPERPHK